MTRRSNNPVLDARAGTDGAVPLVSTAIRDVVPGARASHQVSARETVRARESAAVEGLLDRAEQARDGDLSALLKRIALRRLDRSRPTRHRAQTPSEPEPHSGPRPAPQAQPERQSRGAPALLERAEVSPDLLRLKVSRPAGFQFAAGQHVKMGLPGLTRTYSLASAPHDAHLEFFLELIPGGRLSERLRHVAPGAAMAVSSRAKGKLHLDGGRPNQLMVATVTGIAPYRSLLRDYLARRMALRTDRRTASRSGSQTGGRGATTRFVILHGASYFDELAYAEELAELARRHPDTISYIPTVSRPDSPRNRTWQGARGRADTLFPVVLERLGLTPADTAVFACGNPGMVRNVATGARSRGFAVQTEPFD